MYNYSEKKCKVLDLSCKKVHSFTSFANFGDWFSSNFTDNTKTFSRYEESGLPQFDYELRKNGTPWPGNIDDLLIDKKLVIFSVLLSIKILQNALLELTITMII